MNYTSAGRMDGTKKTLGRESRLARFGRRLTGDWWQLETLDEKRFGVWHPWRRHRWENYRFTKAEAQKEQSRRNSGRHYDTCEECGCTYASHHNGLHGGIECP